jgi:hypothetical protein
LAATAHAAETLVCFCLFFCRWPRTCEARQR